MTWKPGNVVWTDAEDAVIMDGINRGWTRRQTAAMLPFRTRMAVIGRHYRHPEKFKSQRIESEIPDTTEPAPLPPPGKGIGCMDGGCRNTRVRHSTHGLCSIHDQQRIRDKRRARINSGDQTEFRLESRV
jgi:hypothetical protein